MERDIRGGGKGSEKGEKERLGSGSLVSRKRKEEFVYKMENGR